MLNGAGEISAFYLSERVRVQADGATNVEMSASAANWFTVTAKGFFGLGR
jgi:hypothetical protein